MSLQALKSLIEENKTVTFYLNDAEPIKDHGKYVCQISFKDDEHLIFSDSIEELFSKLERRLLRKKED